MYRLLRKSLFHSIYTHLLSFSLSITMFSKAVIAFTLVAAPLALAQTYASTTTFTFAGAALPTGLVASDWPIGEAPYQHEYKPENAVVSGGFLNLIVNGGQQDDEVIWSGEVSTDFTVSSARVETYAILSDVPGVCNGKRLLTRMVSRQH